MNFNIKKEELVNGILCDFNYAEIESIIKMLDEGIEDWGFTERVYKYFNKLHKEYVEYVEEIQR